MANDLSHDLPNGPLSARSKDGYKEARVICHLECYGEVVGFWSFLLVLWQESERRCSGEESITSSDRVRRCLVAVDGLYTGLFDWCWENLTFGSELAKRMGTEHQMPFPKKWGLKAIPRPPAHGHGHSGPCEETQRLRKKKQKRELEQAQSQYQVSPVAWSFWNDGHDLYTSWCDHAYGIWLKGALFTGVSEFCGNQLAQFHVNHVAARPQKA